jgi:hypothetical protein
MIKHLYFINQCEVVLAHNKKQALKLIGIPKGEAKKALKDIKNFDRGIIDMEPDIYIEKNKNYYYKGKSRFIGESI